MKKFLSGFLCAVLVFSLAISALALTGNVSFNKSAIKFNGKIISAAGEGYALANGCEAPASITYTDELGGGTTYLPARRVSELLNVDIGWDAAAGAVTIGAEPAEPAPAPDYSDLSDEERAYQEWKDGWTIEKHKMEWYSEEIEYAGVVMKNSESEIYVLDSRDKMDSTYIGDLKPYYISHMKDGMEKYAIRIANELHTDGLNTVIGFRATIGVVYTVVITIDGNIATESILER